jgi:hypothetical protein
VDGSLGLPATAATGWFAPGETLRFLLLLLLPDCCLANGCMLRPPAWRCAQLRKANEHGGSYLPLCLQFRYLLGSGLPSLLTDAPLKTIRPSLVLYPCRANRWFPPRGRPVAGWLPAMHSCLRTVLPGVLVWQDFRRCDWQRTIPALRFAVSSTRFYCSRMFWLAFPRLYGTVPLTAALLRPYPAALYLTCAGLPAPRHGASAGFTPPCGHYLVCAGR